MHWEHGHKVVEDFKVGDRLYAREEFDPNGPIELKAIEEVFIRQGIVLELTVGGQVIGTTAEHPFYAYGKGWTPAHELTVGELIATADGRWLPIEKLYNTSQVHTVYNFRIADHHTYFVGNDRWGFAVWVHNAKYRKGTPGKPLYAPDPTDWIKNGGRIDINKRGVWTYHDWEGNAVSYPKGYPDFKAAGMVRQRVPFNVLGNRTTDFSNADALAPLGPKLETNSWHHHESLRYMEEIDATLHARFTHIGGVAIKKRRGG